MSDDRIAKGDDPMNAVAMEVNARHPSAMVSLKPKEHGAYAIVMIPMLTAVVTQGVGVVGAAVVVATLAGFFAHEPLLVALGHRGRRVRRDAPEARTRALGWLSLSVVAGTLAMGFGSPTVRLSLAGCLGFAILCLTLAAARLHRTLGGQLMGVAGLSVPCVPILIAGGMSVPHAAVVWLVWLIGFMSITLAVRGVIAAQKRQPRTLHWWGLGLATMAIVGAAMSGIWLPLAALPMVAASGWLMVSPPPAKYLKRIGWTLIGVTIATAAFVACGMTP